MKKLLTSLLILGVSVAPALAVPGTYSTYSSQVRSYFKKPVSKRKSAPNPLGIYDLWVRARPGVSMGSCNVGLVTPTRLVYTCAGIMYNPTKGNVTVTSSAVFTSARNGYGYFTSK